MCTACGCGKAETWITGHDGRPEPMHFHEHEHRHADGTVHTHHHEHGSTQGHEHSYDDSSMHTHLQQHAGEHLHAHGDDLHFGGGAAAAHAPGMTQERMLRVEQDILAKNNAYAEANRRWFADRGVFAVNLVSSPGSGKTTLLVRTIQELTSQHAIAVIEGDQQTSLDAERIRATGVPALQVNTGKGCHLDAQMIGRALARMSVADASLLLIENVGNLVCPAEFDLGEAHKVVILSVTEGEDKPLKYPNMFRAADVMLLNKVDLLPHLRFDVEQCLAYARRVNPAIRVMQVAATTGAGLDEWYAWLAGGLAQARARQDHGAERRRLADVEARLGAKAS